MLDEMTNNPQKSCKEMSLLLSSYFTLIKNAMVAYYIQM